MAVARYSLAVDRRRNRNSAEGEQTADFINCIAFGRNGEFAEKYLKQGMKMIVRGRIQTGSYTNREGQKVYTTEVIVEDHEFAESKKTEQVQSTVQNVQKAQNDGFMELPDDFTFDANDPLEGLPFNM